MYASIDWDGNPTTYDLPSVLQGFAPHYGLEKRYIFLVQSGNIDLAPFIEQQSHFLEFWAVAVELSRMNNNNNNWLKIH